MSSCCGKKRGQLLFYSTLLSHPLIALAKPVRKNEDRERNGDRHE
jgi:hypothetical protein